MSGCPILLEERLFPPLNKRVVLHDLPKIEMGKNIPKIIHQTFKTRNLPPELQENVDKLKAKNPGWEYRFYDDSDIIKFISTFYGYEILTYFERINPKYGAARADLFRYLLMYIYGGVYLDIKSTFTKPIDEVLQPSDLYLLASWRNRPNEDYEGWGMHKEVSMVASGEFQQWHIISTNGHPFLRAVIDLVLTNIDLYKPWLHGTGSYGIYRLTGPVAYTLAIYPLLSSHPHRSVRTDGELSLSYSILKDSRSHRPLFESHYRTLNEPIINVEGINKVLFQVASKLLRTTSLGYRYGFRQTY